jgi:membrane protein implicated in regulation of membrane protease activity
MDWWIWILLGLLLCVAELTTPGGFYILFFGIGAVIVGILVGFQAAGPPLVSIYPILRRLGALSLALP